MSTPSEAAAEVLAVVIAALEAAGRPVTDSALEVGTIAWDDCCAGYAYAGVSRRFRSLRFPVEDLVFRPCDSGPWAAELIVGVQRCISTLDDSGRPPSSAATTSDSLGVYEDGDIVWDALSQWTCDTGWTAMIAGQVYVGAQGGCIEVTTRLFVSP